MGKIRSLIYFDGKVGNTVGRKGRGGSYILSQYQPTVKNPQTTIQMQTRKKFTMLSKLGSKIDGLIMKTFKAAAVDGMTPYNAFMKHNWDDCVTGTWPAYVLNFPKLIVSKGLLANPYAPSCSAQGLDLSLSWSDNSGIGNAKDTDLIAVVVYNSDKDECAVDEASAPRSARQSTFTCPSPWTGDKIEVYLCTITAKGDLSSTSLFLGEFTL